MLFMQILRRLNLKAANTFIPDADTFYGQEQRSSRIDFVCIPIEKVVKICKTLPVAQRVLQIQYESPA